MIFFPKCQYQPMENNAVDYVVYICLPELIENGMAVVWKNYI